MRSTRLNLIGQRFGRIVVQAFSHVNKDKRTYWIGVCDCGKTTEPIQGKFLTTGETKSCGCYQKESKSKNGKAQAKNISGQVFGYITALSPTEKRSGGSIVWLCLCSCGNICGISVNHLVRKVTTSCGCRRISKFHEDTRQAIKNLGVEIYQEEFPIPQSGFNFDRRTTILRIDFVVIVERKLIAIECQGIQHYKPVEFFGGEEKYQEGTKRDILKKLCLKAMGIPLVEVRYDEDDIENFLRQRLSL